MTTPTVNLAPLPKQRFTDTNGNPLAGGKVFTYAAGTNTKQNSYTDSTGSTPNQNPVILDSRGEAAVWLDQTLSYKVTLSPSTDTDPPTAPIWTIDSIPASNSSFITYAAQLLSSIGATLIGFIQAGTGAVSRLLSSKLGDVVTDRDFGTLRNGAASDIAAIQRAHDYLVSIGGGKLQIAPGAPVKALAGDVFTWNPNYVEIDGGGIQWDCSATTVAVSSFINLVQTITDANLRAAANRAHPMSRVRLLGPGTGSVAVPNVTAANITDGTGVNSCAGLTFRDCTFTNWWQDATYGNGAFFITWDNCVFNISGGIGYNVSHLINSGVNSGEGIHIRGGFIGKVYGTGVRNLNGNSSVFISAQMDYMQCVIDAQGGCTFFDGYTECNRDSDYWFKQTGQNTVLRVRGEIALTPLNLANVAITGTAGQFSCTAPEAGLAVGQTVTVNGTFTAGGISGYTTGATYWIIATNGTTTFTLSATFGGSAVTTTVGAAPLGVTINPTKFFKEIFYSDSTGTNGGLDIDIAREFGSQGYQLSMIGGTGQYSYREAGNSNASAHPAIGQGCNWLGNGTFASAQLTDGVLAGTTPPAIVTQTTAPGFTKSLKLTGQGGGTNPSWNLSFPCFPGQVFAGSLWYSTASLAGTGGTFFINFVFLDAGGTALSSGTLLALTTNVANGSFLLLSPQIKAPPGTRSIQIGISIFGTTSGAPTAFVGNVIAGVATAS